MYSCNITLKNNPAWVQLKCVDAITILKYLSTKMTLGYINNKNNRKLTPSEKALVSHVYMFEFFFSLIDFKHHINAKSKSQARGK